MERSPRSSSNSSGQYSNSSNPNYLGSFCRSPKIFKNKDLSKNIHNRIIQRKKHQINPKPSKKERNQNVKAISVKKTQPASQPIQKTCSGEPYRKDPTEYQMFNTELTLVEPQLEDKDQIETEIIDMDYSELDYSNQSQGSIHFEQFSGRFEHDSDSSRQEANLIKGLNDFEIGLPPREIEIESENSAQEEEKQRRGDRYSGASCPELIHEKVEKIRKSTLDEIPSEQKEEKVEDMDIEVKL